MIDGKVLHTTDNYIFFCKGLTIYKRSIVTNGISKFIDLEVQPFIRWGANFELLSRFFRAHIHHMIEDGIGGFYIIYLKSLLRVNKNGTPYSAPVKLIGNRPLCVTLFNNYLVYGEYCDNSVRESVGVYKFDGVKLDLFFNVSGVRHIHGVFYDKHSSELYVTTGDYHNEAGIWKFDESGSCLSPVLVGGQQCRAVQLLFDEENIYFGTDTPIEQNYIYKLNKKSKTLSEVAKVSSSVFYGTYWQSSFIFSTVVEPSKYNRTKTIEIWQIYQNSPRLLRTYNKDFWSMKYFQYGQVSFPSQCQKYPNPDLWFSHLSTSLSGKSEKIGVQE